MPRLPAITLSMLAALSIGCAQLPSMTLEERQHPALEHQAELSPAGPGTIFASPEAAAMDALAYSFLQARAEVVSARRMRGGAIRETEGGFTYDEPAVAPRRQRAIVQYPLAPGDVAHFQLHPTRPTASAAARGLRVKSLDDQARYMVDTLDPAQRPLFYLTPERFVRVHEAGADGPRSLGRVRFGTRHDATSLALQLTDDAPQGAESGLALVPTDR